MTITPEGLRENELQNELLLDNAATCSQHPALEEPTVRECITLNIINPLRVAYSFAVDEMDAYKDAAEHRMKERDAALEELAKCKEFEDAMFPACCYLDRAIPVAGYATNADRVRAAADQIIALREELAAVKSLLAAAVKMQESAWTLGVATGERDAKISTGFVENEADALEELARLKAPVEVAGIVERLRARDNKYLSRPDFLCGDAAAALESLAAQVAEAKKWEAEVISIAQKQVVEAMAGKARAEQQLAEANASLQHEATKHAQTVLDAEASTRAARTAEQQLAERDDDDKLRETILSALSLLAAAEANDGMTPETDAVYEDGKLTLMQHAKQLERQRNGLAAEVERLRGTLEEINLMACYASEEDTDSREAMLLKIGESARTAIAWSKS